MRVPTLFEIFFGKLANWIRRLRAWRKQGLLKKAAQLAQRRRRVQLEALEPRVLLSADLTYGAGAAHDLTLVAEQAAASDPVFLKLYETGTSHELDSQLLTDANDLAVKISRSELGVNIGAAAADTLHIDTDSLAILNSFVSSHGGKLEVRFDGGSEALANDHVKLDGAATTTLDYGLVVGSTSDIVVGVGNLTVGGDLSVESEDEISVSHSTVSSGTHDISLTVHSSSDGIFGVDIFGPASASISVDHAALSGNDIGLTASSTVTLAQGGLGFSLIRVAEATATSDADIAVGGNSHINATGNLTIAALSTVTASAEIKPDASGNASETTDAAVANRRSCGSVSPVIRPRNPLRLVPRTNGRPSTANSPRRRSSSRLC